MRSDIVEVARSWIGTPYLHQASVKGVGCDCLGLLRGVWREAFGAEPEKVPPYTPDWSEPQGDEVLMRAAQRHLGDVSGTPMMAGQVVLFRMRKGAVAKHLGIVGEMGETATFIHAYSGHGVVESSFSRPWLQRVAARFAFLEG